jgi:beta-xylosidase
MGKLTLLASVLVLVASASIGHTEALYKNPVIAGDHPDPSIIRVGKDFWATCTSSEWGPIFPLLHSTDLVNWELTGSVFEHRPDWATANFWAPEISEYKNHYYVYYVGRKRGGPLTVAVATADKPGGPYTDRGPLVSQDDGSIDPSAATDENGVRYLIWKEDGNSQQKPTPIFAQRFADDGTKLAGEPHELLHNDAAWEGGVVEGPFILRRNGWFYLFYSGNGCCGTGCNYALGVARSRTLLGPWEKNPANPILAENQTWKCPGHGSIAMDAQGRYFLLYHAYSAGGSIFTGREGMLDEVKFGANGWPTINDGKGPSVQAVSPLGVVQHTNNDTSYADDFSGDHLQPGWQWPQGRVPAHEVMNGKLKLGVTGRGTNFLAAILARSTTVADYAVTTAIETKSLKPGGAAGVCAFGDTDNAIGAALQDGKIVTWRREHGTTRHLTELPAPAGDKLFLRLTARLGYHFQVSVSDDGAKWLPCGETTDAKDLPPWDRSVRVALTVGGIANAEAVFDSFSLKPVEPSTKNSL